MNDQNLNPSKDLLPEEQAREIIDSWLQDAGWLVVSRSEYSDTHSAQAVKENLMNGNLEADYVLYLSGKAIAVIEAKKKSNKLKDDVKKQAEDYTKLLRATDQFWIKPLPFVFISNGEKLLFRDMRDPNGEYEDLKQKMMTPRQLIEKTSISDEFVSLPAVLGVGKGKLRQCQHDAIENVELNFRRGVKRCLLDLATGSGKTFTACMLSYRLLKYTPAEKILYLVDRNNLGKQTFDEYNSFKLTQTGEPFTSIYSVERLKRAEQAKSINISICTIQRLFSILTGQNFSDDDDNDDDEVSFFFDDVDDNTPAIELKGDLKLEKDLFDLIIIDECHRSIYGKWRSVLEYFSKARIVGLTATPTPQTYAFFNCSCVNGIYTPTYVYSIDKSYVDGVNVPPIIFRIKTSVTEEGGLLHDNQTVIEENRLTGEKKLITVKNPEKYSKNDVDRSVVNPTQIKTVLTAFRDKVFDEMFTNRSKDWRYLPKTLIFAKSERHADLIIEQIHEVFASKFDDKKLPKNFVQKITHTQQNPIQLIKDFRYNKDFRIAVTVTLVATGTDVRPLEVVLFMRDIHSLTLYTQMKGRGCRAIDDDKLRTVTPNADTKENFYLIDAVGVTESEKNISLGTDPGKDPITTKVTLEQVLEWLAHGYVSDDNLEYLAQKLASIKNRTSSDHLKEFYDLAGIELETLASNIFDALEKNKLPPYFDINEPNNERKLLISKLIDNPKARELLLKLAAGFVKILNPGEDTLLYSGFSLNDAIDYTTQFENYVKEHKDELEALKIIYNDEDKIITTTMLVDLEKRLAQENPIFKDYSVIWNAYNTLSTNNKILKKVKKLSSKSEKDALTNLIQMIRFAYDKVDTLQAINGIATKRFNLYIGQHLGIDKRDFTKEQIEVLMRLADYVTQKGCVVRADFRNDNQTPLMIDLIKIYSNPKLDDEINYFSKFILGISTKAA